MRALVTGGAGFIGSNLVDRLIEEGHEVVVVDNLSSGNILNINSKARFFKQDICEPLSEKIMEGVEVVFHVAAVARVQLSIMNPYVYHDVNVNGTVNLLEACRAFGVKRIVYSSSSSVYGDTDTFPTPEGTPLNPMSPYALNKLVCEQYLKLYSDLYGIESISLRYFNVYGERQLLNGPYACAIGIFINQRMNEIPMTIRGDGKQRRDFTYVGDVVDANVKAATSKYTWKGSTFNIGNGDNRSVNQIAKMIGGDVMYVDPVTEPKETLADNSKALFHLDWKPTIKVEDWIKKYKEELKI